MAALTLPAPTGAPKATGSTSKSTALKNRISGAVTPVKDDFTRLAIVAGSAMAGKALVNWWESGTKADGSAREAKLFGIDFRLLGAAAPFVYGMMMKKTVPGWATGISTGLAASWAVDWSADWGKKKDDAAAAGIDEAGRIGDNRRAKKIEKLERELAILRDKQSGGKLLGEGRRGGRGRGRMIDYDNDGDLDRVRVNYRE